MLSLVIHLNGLPIKPLACKMLEVAEIIHRINVSYVSHNETMRIVQSFLFSVTEEGKRISSSLAIL